MLGSADKTRGPGRIPTGGLRAARPPDVITWWAHGFTVLIVPADPREPVRKVRVINTMRDPLRAVATAGVLGVATVHALPLAEFVGAPVVLAGCGPTSRADLNTRASVWLPAGMCAYGDVALVGQWVPERGTYADVSTRVLAAHGFIVPPLPNPASLPVLTLRIEATDPVLLDDIESVVRGLTEGAARGGRVYREVVRGVRSAVPA